MPSRITADELKKRKDRLTELREKRNKELARLARKIEREEAQEELETYAALGRRVASVLGISKLHEFDSFCQRSGCLAFVEPHSQDAEGA